MLTAQIEELLDHLRTGEFHPEDAHLLEGTSARDLVADLDSVYRFRFQERRIRTKWEIGVARSLRYELTALPIQSSLFFNAILAPVFRNCLFLTSESEAITGISVATRIDGPSSPKTRTGGCVGVGAGI